MEHLKLIIIWAGSAGLPAGMYASRYNIDNLVIGHQPGWALATSHQVENWPGIYSESGKTIMDTFEEHAKISGSKILQDLVTGVVEQDDKTFLVTTQGWESYTCDYLLIATGNVYRKLGVPGESELIGAGVSYCATCDGMFFKNKDIVLVGGGDTAFTEALYLAEIASTVKVLVRKDKPKAEAKWVERVENTDNIEILYNTSVEKVQGKFMVESILTTDGREIACNGIFVAIGSDPNISLVEWFWLEKDTEACIVVDARQKTSHPKIYAAGDVTTNSNKFKQTIMSAAEGCLSANSIHEDILDNS